MELTIKTLIICAFVDTYPIYICCSDYMSIVFFWDMGNSRF